MAFTPLTGTGFTPIRTQGFTPIEGPVTTSGFTPIEEPEFTIDENIPFREYHSALKGILPSFGRREITPELSKKVHGAEDRFQVTEILKSLPSEISEEVRKKALLRMKERKHGAVFKTPFSPTQTIKNVPDNVRNIINSFSSLLVGIPYLTATTAKELSRESKKSSEREKRLMQNEPITPDLEPEELTVTKGIKSLGRELKEDFRVFKEDPAHATAMFVQKNPVDALLLAGGASSLAGAGVSTVGKVAKINRIVSRTRKPLRIGNIEVERKFSKNPITKELIEKPFDAALERYPKLKNALVKYKEGKMTTDMRNTYEELNFNERARLHEEVFENIEKLSKRERELMIPFLEGKLHFKKDLPGDTQGLVDLSKKKGGVTEFTGEKSRWGRGSENIDPQRIANFEGWYRGFQKKVERGFKLDETMTPKQLDDVLYQPLEIETGLSREIIKKELGDFTPAYVHHFFPAKAKDIRGVHFAETTGKKFKPGLLKERTGAKGYSEDLTEILPRVASSYVKWKNNRAFLEEFTDTFGTPVNLRNIKPTKDGLMVKGKLFPGHKIVAPDGYLRFHKGEVDIWKEIAKKMDDTTDFDESLLEILQSTKAATGELKKDFTGVSKNMKVWLVPDEAAERLESMSRPFLGSQKAQNFAKLYYDTPVQVWKDSVLAFSPRWIKNNVLSDIVFNTFEGVGPFSYARGFSKKYRDVIPDEIARASFANVMKYNPRLGKAGDTIVGQYLQKVQGWSPVRAATWLKNKGYDINTAFEQPFVRALYIKTARTEAKKLLKKDGVDINSESIMTKLAEMKDNSALVKSSIKKVKDTLPVFNKLGSMGRMYGKRAMPFLNWYKFMAEYAVKLPVNHPFKTVGARGLSELSEDQREEVFKQYFPVLGDEINSNGIPDRFDGLWPIGMDKETGEGVFFNARGMNPFTTLEDFMDLKIFNMMSPIIKVGAERSLGVNSFTGQKFDAPEQIKITPEGQVREIEKNVPSLFTHIARQFPQFSLLEQTLTPAQQYSTGTVFNPKPKLDPITGEYKYPIKSLDKIFNYMGVDKKTIDVEKWLDTHRERIKGKVAATHKAALFDPDALSVDEYLVLVNEIVSDEVLMEKILRDMERKEKFKIKKERRKIEAITK